MRLLVTDPLYSGGRERVASPEEELAFAESVLLRGGWLIRAPGKFDAPVTSELTGTMDEFPFQVEQHFVVKIGDKLLVTKVLFHQPITRGSLDSRAGATARAIGMTVADDIRPAIEREMQWAKEHAI